MTSGKVLTVERSEVTLYDNHTLVLTPGKKNRSGGGGSVPVDRYLGNSV